MKKRHDNQPGFAKEPIADERFVSRMAPEMRSEVRGLAVLLIASGDVANVDLASGAVRFAALLAIGTSARNATLLLHLPI